MLTRLRPYSLVLLAALVLLFSLLNKGKFDVQEWDEARNGINAIEMLNNKDYVNLYYDGELDTWNAKPPLLIWSIALSYKLFGFNEFALRFPTTISALVFFFFCFNLFRTFAGYKISLLTCLILLATKAIFTVHVGLTGDFDMMLMMFLTASLYYFLLFSEKEKKWAIFVAALFMGLAFYTKGPASLIFVPGLFIYLLIRKPQTYKDFRLWLAGLLFIAISASWIVIAAKWGKTSSNSYYGSGNSIEVMFIHDTFRRLTEPDFDSTGNKSRDLAFIFKALDAKLNLWNYMLYLLLAIYLYKLVKKKSSLRATLLSDKHFLLIFALCMILPLGLILSLAQTAHFWYFAPALPFVAYLIARGLLTAATENKILKPAAVLLLIFTLLRQGSYLCELPTNLHKNYSANKLLTNQTIVAVPNLRQDVLLYLKWLNVKREPLDLEEPLKDEHQLLFLNEKLFRKHEDQLFLKQYLGGYYLVSKK